ncbi:MAG: CHRD domain-containing protein [Saprospiraceae bacterium]|nr:CHRD domain-containing protein [Lewinella sp.]
MDYPSTIRCCFSSVSRKWTLSLIALLFVFPGAELFAGQVYQAMLRGRHESLPVSTPAHGMITASLDGNVLTVEGSFSGLSGDFASDVAGGSHIHLAYAGQNGGIQIRLNATLDEDLHGGDYLPENNTFTLTEEQLQALTERRLYVNIHSTASRSGELRGQLLPAADAYYYSNLLGSNEVPSVMSAGSGGLALELNGSMLTVSGSFQNLEGTLATEIRGGSHIHLGFAGENGGIQLLLKITASEDGKSGIFAAADNSFELTPQLARALELRQLYANVHSSIFRGGELRGQILGMARTAFRAHLSGSNENPAVTSLASGVVMAELMADDRLVISGAFSGLESKMALNTAGGAHIHRAMAGMNGPVMFRLFVNPRGDLRSGAFRADRNANKLSPAQVTALYNRGMYVNIHSLINGSGEIRGQLLPESQIVFSGFLSSIFQTAGQISTGGGAVKAELSGNRLILSGAFRGLSTAVATEIAGGAHIHRGMAGSNGPITQPLNITFDGDMTQGVFEAANNVFDLTEEDIAQLRSRSKYINVHTQKYRPGEIRSQLLPEAAAYFLAPLSGSSQTNPINTAGTGMLILEVNANRGIGSGSFNNLSTPLATFIAGGAHIHASALAGQNAGIAFPLASTLNDDQLSGIFPAADNVLFLPDDFIATLRDRATYVNVHSDQYRPGEIRGQLLPLATAYLTATLSGQNSNPVRMTDGRGQVKAELHGDVLVVTGSFSGLTGDFATAIAGGSHLHFGAAGVNGPIRVFTNAELDDDLKGGRYLAEDNTFDLDAGTIADLIAGNLYLNLHSTVYRPGEIRGQMLAEINAFPSAGAAITAPVSGTDLTISGDPATAFSVEWSAAADRDQLSYIWQLSTGVAFDDLLVNAAVGPALSYTTDFAAIDNLLVAAGLEIGESIMLFHRAIASDGSVATAGPPSAVMLTRGAVEQGNLRLGSNANAEPAISGFKVFPNVLQNGQSLNVRIAAGVEETAVLVLVNALGQPLQSRSVDLFAGENTLEWNLSDLAPGHYFVQLKMARQLLPLQRIVVQ